MDSENMIKIEIEKIPVWRRVIMCLCRYKKWRIARAYNTVAADIWRRNDIDRFKEIDRIGIDRWAEIYGIKSYACAAKAYRSEG